MGWVDILAQRPAAYQLDCKSAVCFYLCIFFDLLDIHCVNSFLVHNMKHPKQLTLPDCKTVIEIKDKSLNKDNTVEKDEKTLNYAIYILHPPPTQRDTSVPWYALQLKIMFPLPIYFPSKNYIWIF